MRKYSFILIIFFLLNNSCSLIDRTLFEQKNIEEIKFVNELVNHPKIMDSILIKSKYFNQEIFKLIEHQINSEGNLIEYYTQNNCKPKIRNVFNDDSCSSRNNINFKNCIYISYSYPCRKDDPYGFIFVFAEINKEKILVDIYGTHF